MKRSDTALLSLACLLIGGLVATGFMLKEESGKIDLTDPLRNYDSERVAPFRVLKISGSNGYPIEVEQADTNSLTVLRRRKGFLKTRVQGDTLEIVFLGANIPLDQADKSTTQAGVIIRSKGVAHMQVADTYTRIRGFRKGGLVLHLAGNAFNDFVNCDFTALTVEAKNNSRFQFKEHNSADTISITLQNNAVGFLKNIAFSKIRHQVGDSASVVLSSQSLRQVGQLVPAE